MIIRPCLFVLGASLLLGGCGKDDDDSSDDANSSITGGWRSECDNDLKDDTSSLHSVDIGTDQFITYQYSFWLTGCNTQMSLSEKFVFDATYDDQGSGTTFMDMTVVSMEFTPRLAEFVTALNENSVCGVSTWEKDAATSVAGKNCGGYAMPAVGDKLKGLYTIDGEKLTVGYGTTRPAKPDSANVTDIYIKQ
jgi:hypothetical protein